MMNSVILRASKYLEKIDPAISGSGGHTQAYKAAMAMVQDFDLADDVALTLLRKWNGTNSPPFPDSDLIHKVSEARKNIDPAKVGSKLGDGVRERSINLDPVERWAGLRAFMTGSIKTMGGRPEGDCVGFPMYVNGCQVGLRLRHADGSKFKNDSKAITNKGGSVGLILSQKMRETIPEGATVLITEGEPNGCALLDAGAEYVVVIPSASAFRTANTELQRMLAGHRGKAILFPDAGKDGTKLARLLTTAFVVVGVELLIVPPNGVDDLDERLRRESDRPSALRALIEQAIPAARIYPDEPESKTEKSDVTPENLYQLTDLGNAERFKVQHGEVVLFDPAGGWRVWNNRHWKADASHQVDRLAHQTARSLFSEASKATDPNTAALIGKWAVRSQSRDRLAAIVAVASHLMVVESELFDTDPWALNCLNGTLNLKTGELRLHRREDYITRLAPVEYHVGATHPIVDQVLTTAMPDPELRRYAQKLLGVTLIGEQVDDHFILVHGPAGSGKTSVLEPFKKLVGDYGATVDPESLMVSNGNPGGARGDLARLAGVRLALTTEVDDGSKLAVGLVKRLSGGDTITARKLYRDEFEYIPQFTLWIVANHQPRADSADGGLWRRIKVLPFNHVIPAEQRDIRIKQTMLSDPGCLSALLAWAVEGVQLYLAEGLRAPAVVTEATEEYREAQDPLKDFFDARCVIDPREKAESVELRKAYLSFCIDEGCKFPLGPKQFTERLRNVGFRQVKSNGYRFWEGLDLIQGRQGRNQASYSITSPYEKSQSKVTETDAASRPLCPQKEKQAAVLLDRLAAHGVVVHLDDAHRVTVLGRLDGADAAELDRLNDAVREVLLDRREDDLFGVKP